eukprot:5997744-Pleurochrysis_carterae.AAC.1
MEGQSESTFMPADPTGTIQTTGGPPGSWAAIFMEWEAGLMPRQSWAWRAWGWGQVEQSAWKVCAHWSMTLRGTRQTVRRAQVGGSPMSTVETPETRPRVFAWQISAALASRCGHSSIMTRMAAPRAMSVFPVPVPRARTLSCGMLPRSCTALV